MTRVCPICARKVQSLTQLQQQLVDIGLPEHVHCNLLLLCSIPSSRARPSDVLSVQRCIHLCLNPSQSSNVCYCGRDSICKLWEVAPAASKFSRVYIKGLGHVLTVSSHTTDMPNSNAASLAPSSSESLSLDIYAQLCPMDHMGALVSSRLVEVPSTRHDSNPLPAVGTIIKPLVSIKQRRHIRGELSNLQTDKHCRHRHEAHDDGYCR